MMNLTHSKLPDKFILTSSKVDFHSSCFNDSTKLIDMADAAGFLGWGTREMAHGTIRLACGVPAYLIEQFDPQLPEPNQSGRHREGELIEGNDGTG